MTNLTNLTQEAATALLEEGLCDRDLVKTMSQNDLDELIKNVRKPSGERESIYVTFADKKIILSMVYSVCYWERTGYYDAPVSLLDHDVLRGYQE